MFEIYILYYNNYQNLRRHRGPAHKRWWYIVHKVKLSRSKFMLESISERCWLCIIYIYIPIHIHTAYSCIFPNCDWLICMLVVLQHLLLPIPKVWSIFVDDILCWTKLVSFVKSEVWMHYIYTHLQTQSLSWSIKKGLIQYVSPCFNMLIQYWLLPDIDPSNIHLQYVLPCLMGVKMCILPLNPATFEAIFSRLELADLVEVPGQSSRLDVENSGGYTPCWLFNSLLCQMAHVSMNYDGFL